MQPNLINGWREVLARIFDGFETEYGVTPEWLVNPDTNRRLKLDCLFPDMGVAVRFVGLEGNTKRRKSDQEVDRRGRTRAHPRGRVSGARRGADHHRPRWRAARRGPQHGN